MDFHMLHQQGLRIRKIAALRGVSRNAVRRALRSSSPPSGKRRREKGCKLKAFEPLVTTWLADPVTSQWTARRMFEELEDRGYVGGYTVVKDFVALNRPRPVPTAEARFFVKAGQQLQVDWAEMGVAAQRQLSWPTVLPQRTVLPGELLSSLLVGPLFPSRSSTRAVERVAEPSLCLMRWA